jgi:superfamily II DNA or RNA helicase
MIAQLELFRPGTRAGIVPRDYQVKDHDESFRQWDAGTVGVLTRAATGSGKSIMGCLKIDTWLQRGENYRCMVLSYETQLVWQFADEVRDVLGLEPGIEMDQYRLEADEIPQVVVASRASLLLAPPPEPEQVAELAKFGITDLGPTPARACKRFLNFLQKGGDPDDIRAEIEVLKQQPEASGSRWSRLHKFDWHLNWLLVMDEAHRWSYRLCSVQPIVDWFDQNPASRRNGITATPKRSDGVSIGDKMFPGIALDYPLWSPNKPCAVKDGYAVPYIQKYIEVKNVDFRSLAKLGEDFDEADLERRLGEEKTLASLIIPLLDLVGTRKTLIFSPGVEMAKNVARFINARAEAECPACHRRKWYPHKLIGDGAMCECGRLVDRADVLTRSEPAKELDGASPDDERKQVYKRFASGQFQFLSVCGLCREGFNDPDVSCIAIFRPVSKKASGLAEQMKGRGCRLARSLAKTLHAFSDAESRCKARDESEKPNCLIVDLVGCTGLADCASTVQIYAEGLADELREEGHEESEAQRIAEELLARAAEILEEKAKQAPVSVEEAVQQAKREDAEAREKARLEREAAEQKARELAEKRAKAGADVQYNEMDVGYGSQHDPLAATDAQYRYAAFLGMDIKVLRSKRQLGRIINMLKLRTAPEEVAKLNRLDEDSWSCKEPSPKQKGFMQYKGIPAGRARTPYDASLLLDAKLDPAKFAADRKTAIAEARCPDELTAVAKDIALARGVLPPDLWDELVSRGKRIRESMQERVA